MWVWCVFLFARSPAFVQLIRALKLNYWSIDGIAQKCNSIFARRFDWSNSKGYTNNISKKCSALNVPAKSISSFFHSAEREQKCRKKREIERYFAVRLQHFASFLFTLNFKLWAIKFNQNEHINAKMEKWIMNTQQKMKCSECERVQKIDPTSV